MINLKTATKSEKAIYIHDNQLYKKLTEEEQFLFQINEKYLAMPWDVFHSATEKALNRPVWTHEFADPEYIKSQYRNNAKVYSMDELLSME